MSDGSGLPIGIQFRSWDGRKSCVRGSRLGLFIPKDIVFKQEIVVTEGASDCAALLDLGFAVVGRPSCGAGIEHVIRLVQKYRIRSAVIAADSDMPGLDGAYQLASRIAPFVSVARVFSPPPGVKDVRAWTQRGATRGDIENAMELANDRASGVVLVASGEGASRE